MALNHRYCLFGLTLASELELPGLMASRSDVADVAIRQGVVGQQASISIEGVARFAVVGGQEIVVEAWPDAPTRNVRLYLLGSAMGLLLHQRGLLPLHANAVEVDGGAVAVLGHPGRASRPWPPG